MIHGNSRDPVLIKKISLNVWLLKDEVQAVLKQKLEKSEGDKTKIPINDLRSEYVGDSSSSDAPADAEIVSADNLDTGEDEMAAAIAEAEAEEAAKAAGEEPEASTEDEGSEDTSADDMAAAMLEGQVPVEEEAPAEEPGYIQRKPLVPADRLFKGRTILAEVDLKTMYFFCNENFMEGQSIVIEFLIPKRFVLNAEVIYCRKYNLKSRIISENKLPYRVVVNWSFLKEGERTLLRKFLQSVEPDVPEEIVPVKAPSSGGGGGGDDDDFDELDDLDL